MYIDVFDLPAFYFIPAALFWLAAAILIIILIVKYSIDFYNWLMKNEYAQYIYNDETNELAKRNSNGTIEIIGTIH